MSMPETHICNNCKWQQAPKSRWSTCGNPIFGQRDLVSGRPPLCLTIRNLEQGGSPTCKGFEQAPAPTERKKGEYKLTALLVVAVLLGMVSLLLGYLTR